MPDVIDRYLPPAPEPSEDRAHLNAFKGCVLGLTIGALLWLALFFVVLA